MTKATATTESAIGREAARHVPELRRPWKLATFAAGLALMLFGATQSIAMDWDIGISLIMCPLAYVLAPWCVRVLVERRWRWLPLALLAAWFGIDGAYALYWGLKDPEVLALMRDANLRASSPLFALCGVGWLYRGSLADLHRDIRRALARESG
jgi:hypothetical protein